MTLGQRIAQKRKELGLSQEGLGEQLGVSRQAIYKWESDASTPEVEKLIILSRIFSVSIGWLLGVEELEPDGPVPAQDQEKLIEEVLSRYQASQPAPRKSAWDKWSVRILFAMCGVMLALLVGNHSKMKEMDQQYAYLANSIGEVNYSVDRQINSITTRVEAILKSQNTLTAEWSAQLASTDVPANTASFDVRVVPRTYVEGMTALFIARSEEDTAELPVTQAAADGSFSGCITCPLSDQIDLSVVLITGDKRETQWLDNFCELYSSTFPDLRLDSWLWSDERDGVLPAQKTGERTSGPGVRIHNMDENNLLGWVPKPPAAVRVGLFRDRKLVMWYECGVETIHVNSQPKEEYVWRRPRDVAMEPGCEYCEAVVYTDALGRQRIYSGTGVMMEETDSPASASASAVAPYADGLTDWEF